MKRIIILLGIFLSLGLQDCYPKNDIEISLLTCSSGSASFESWGHSAIRVNYNDEKETDIVYDFGRFDFSTTNFYLKFVKGKLRYGIGLKNTHNFINDYLLENREIIEQKLNLSDKVKHEIIKRLEYLYKPENRFYHYDFIDKNCTTQLRDLILDNFEKDTQKQITNKTYRIEINEFLKERQWIRFGINLVFGPSVDNEINTKESMFLPYYLYSGLNDLSINGRKLVTSEKRFNKVETNQSNLLALLNPTLIFVILLILILFIKSPRIQIPIFIIIGLTGLLILLISIITEHQDLKNNFNLLWCNPLYLVAVFFQLKNNSSFQYYLSVTLQLMIVVMIIIWIVKIQSWEIAFFPIVLILSIYNIKIIKTGYNSKIPASRVSVLR